MGSGSTWRTSTWAAPTWRASGCATADSNPVLQGEQAGLDFDVSRAGALAAVIEHMNDAPELFSVAKARAHRLTSINDAYLQTVARGTKEKVEFKSPDGTAVEAFVTRPPGSWLAAATRPC